jgi:2-polyprenyl-3-methyl-5-hydroxy-6-metoxy-1,4-benzoquinol methylase
MHIDEFHPNKFVAPKDTVRKIQQPYTDYFPTGGTVADLGCGEGVFLELLRESGRTGIGVDLTKEFVRSINARGMKAVRKDVFEFLSKNKSKFDGVFASHLIEHFSTSQTLKMIQGMFDSLRPGGVAVLMTPTYDDLLVSSERFWLDITHVRPYPLLLLKEVFRHVGFELVNSGYDPNTRIRGSMMKPHVYLRNFIYKIRFGRYYNLGDTFIVGKKI